MQNNIHIENDAKRLTAHKYKYSKGSNSKKLGKKLKIQETRTPKNTLQSALKGPPKAPLRGPPSGPLRDPPSLPTGRGQKGAPTKGNATKSKIRRPPPP